MKTSAAVFLALSLTLTGGADARQAPVELPNGSQGAATAPAGSFALASCFSFMRSFKRICYSDAVGYHCC